MYSPLRENITTIVKRRAMSVDGLMFGIKLLPISFMTKKRVIIPAAKGMPTYTKTLFAIRQCDIDELTFQPEDWRESRNKNIGIYKRALERSSRKPQTQRSTPYLQGELIPNNHHRDTSGKPNDVSLPYSLDSS